MNNAAFYDCLDRIAAKLDAEASARGLADSGDPLSDSEVTAFRLLLAAIGIAARGVDYFTNEEREAFSRMADKIFSMCDAE
jgi:hypothetical protein